MRWVVRFGYDGSVFAGWARQPGLRTVEGEVIAGLEKHGRGAAVGLEVASRTDRGVSARGNALAVESSLRGPSLLRQLNGICPAIFFSAAAPFPAERRVRSAVRRTYRYFSSGPPGRAARWRSASRGLLGTIDVRSFGRALPSDRPSYRTVESISVDEVPGGLVLEIRAPSFVWGMVRKIVAALDACGEGRLEATELAEAAAGGRRLTLPLAPAEGLVLWEVEYPFAWTVRWAGPTRHQRAWWEGIDADLWRRARIRDALDPDRGRAA